MEAKNVVYTLPSFIELNCVALQGMLSIWVLKLPLSITNVLICLDVALTIVKDKHPMVKGSIYIHHKNKIYCENKLIFAK